eukprot:gene16155-19224_t
MLCKRFARSVLPMLTPHLCLFIEEGVDLRRMLSLATRGLHGGRPIHFGAIEVTRYTKTLPSATMASGGVDLAAMAPNALVRLQSLTIESMLSSRAFLVSLVNNSSLTRLSLATNDFSLESGIIDIIAGGLSNLATLKLFTRGLGGGATYDFVHTLAKRYAESPTYYSSLVNLSITYCPPASILQLLCLPSLHLRKLKLYAIAEHDDRLFNAIASLDDLTSFTYCSNKVDFTSMTNMRNLSRFTKLNLSRIYTDDRTAASVQQMTAHPIVTANIQTLILSQLRLPIHLTTSILQSFSHAQSITTLILDYFTLCDTSITLLCSFLARNRSIVSLSLSNVQFQSTLVARIFYALVGHPTLATFVFTPFYRNRFVVDAGSVEEESLTRMFESCPSLTSFSSYKTDLTNKVLMSILGPSSKLRYIETGRINDISLYSQSLSTNTTLTSLKASTIDGEEKEILTFLSSVSRRQVVQSLELTINTTDAILLFFIKLFNNRKLYNPITQVALKIHPNCQDNLIIWHGNAMLFEKDSL